MQRFLVGSDELGDVVPCGAPRENVLEHVESGVVRRHLLHLADTFSYARLVDKYLGIPQTSLGAGTEHRILSLCVSFLNFVEARLFLLERVHESHRLVLLRQVLIVFAV